jgi:hypothetical protein
MLEGVTVDTQVCPHFDGHSLTGAADHDGLNGPLEAETHTDV